MDELEKMKEMIIEKSDNDTIVKVLTMLHEFILRYFFKED